MPDRRNIGSAKELEQWLIGKPRKLSAALSGRSVLRMLPHFSEKLSSGEVINPRLSVTVFRSIAISRSTNKHPDRIAGAKAAGAAARDAHNCAKELRAVGASSLAYAAAYAAYTDSSVPFASASATSSAGFAESSLGFGRDRFWSPLDEDCKWWTANDLSVDRLCQRALWPSGPSAMFSEAYRVANEQWERNWDSWSALSQWYDRKLAGHTSEWGLPPVEEVEMARRLIAADNDFWRSGSKDPSIVNRQLEQWLSELREGASSDDSLEALRIQLQRGAVFDVRSTEAKEVQAGVREAATVILQALTPEYGGIGHNGPALDDDGNPLPPELASEMREAASILEMEAALPSPDPLVIAEAASRLMRLRRWLRPRFDKFADSFSDQLGKSSARGLVFVGSVTFISLAVGTDTVIAEVVNWLSAILK